MIAHVDKPVFIVAEAYRRSGWAVGPSLELNNETFWWFKDDPRVLGILAFAYGRDGGVVDNPSLQAIYRGIAKHAKIASYREE
jgi:hypothetical protein